MFQLEQTVSPYLGAMAEFRDQIRDIARQQKAIEILKVCDTFRDDVLPNLGVRLEDREGGPSAVKLVDRDSLLKEREAKRMADAQKAAAKEKKRLEAAAAAAAAEAQRKIKPSEMFLHETDKYSAFDDKVSELMPISHICFILIRFFFSNQGLPTLDAKGDPISKGLTKKLEKLQIAQEKKYNEYLASSNKWCDFEHIFHNNHTHMHIIHMCAHKYKFSQQF